jgi:hypothetical protein
VKNQIIMIWHWLSWLLSWMLYGGCVCLVKGSETCYYMIMIVLFDVD